MGNEQKRALMALAFYLVGVTIMLSLWIGEVAVIQHYTSTESTTNEQAQ